MFFRILKTNIGGDCGLISVSNRWMYDVSFSFIVLLISRARNTVSLSASFSMSKSWANCSKSGSWCSFFRSA